MSISKERLDEIRKLLRKLCEAADHYVGWMKSIEGKDDFCMWINEQSSGGGFRWDFLDFKPDDEHNYRKIWITPIDPTASRQIIPLLLNELDSSILMENFWNVRCERLEKENLKLRAVAEAADQLLVAKKGLPFCNKLSDLHGALKAWGGDE